MSVMAFQADKIERAANGLAFFVKTTPPDKLDWQPHAGPQVYTRSVYQMVSECIQINEYMAALLSGKESADSPATQEDLVFANADEAAERLIASGQALASAVRALPEEALTQEFPHWRGPLLGERLIDAPCRNMHYHSGQVNLIQLLLGDTEFHVPPNWR